MAITNTCVRLLIWAKQQGTSFEHIFNLQQAIKNCMLSLQIKSYFIGYYPSNNLMGHGFYQFSPELLYRVFSEEKASLIQRIINKSLFINERQANLEKINPLFLKEKVLSY